MIVTLPIYGTLPKPFEEDESFGCGDGTELEIETGADEEDATGVF